MLFFYSHEFSHFEKSSLFISLCILRDLHQQKIPRELCGGGDRCYISTFPCSHGKSFLMGWNRKIQNTRRKQTDQENSKEQEAKKKKIFLILLKVCGGSHTREFSISWGTPSGYRPHATLPQENPLVWEPPLQHNLTLIDMGGKVCLINHPPLTLKKSKKIFTPFGKASEIFLSVSGGTLTQPKIL
jgi:hypothetical protein